MTLKIGSTRGGNQTSLSVAIVIAIFPKLFRDSCTDWTMINLANE